MEILYYFKDRQTPMYLWQHHHIFSSLQEHGININVFNPLKYKNTEIANEELCKVILQKHFDLFLSPHNETDLFISSIDLIKQTGIPTVLICFDNLTIPFYHKKIANHFDLVWLTSKETKYLFDKWGANSIFLPYAAKPVPIASIENNDIPEVLFIGTPYGSRSRMINNLLNGGVPVSLFTNIYNSHNKNSGANNKGNKCIEKFLKLIDTFCNGYDYFRFPIGRRLAFASLKNKFLRQSELIINHKLLTVSPSVSFEEMNQFYHSFSLSLSSISNKHSGVLKNPIPVINLRNFEIPAAGGILFCHYNEELAGYYNPNDEAVYYDNDEDMIEKAKFYMKASNLSIRNKIKLNAYNRTLSNHTWYHRFCKIFEALNLNH